jgi:Bacterial Ig-like domain (group 3)/Domain of unknown function DUF11
MMAGGLAGTVMAGTAFAGPIIFATTTSITGTSQAQPAWNSDPVVTVNVSVTAGGGNSAPTGDVTVSVAGHSDSCHAALTSSSGLASRGSCELRDLAHGSYTLQAEYAGVNQLGKSVSGDHALTVASSSGQGATIRAHLSCPAAVNAGQSGNCELTVANSGPGTAVNVAAEIALPSALHARYCGNRWWNPGCSLRHNDATWRLGNLRRWQVKSLTVHFTAAGNRSSRSSSLVTVTGSATWGVNFQGQGPMQHIAFSRTRVEIRPWGLVF